MIWERSIKWHKTGDARFPWKAQVDGKTCTIRVNEFPVEKFIYTLVIDDEISFEFNDWPDSWIGPVDVPAYHTDEPAIGFDRHEKAAFDAETEWARRAEAIKASDKIK